LIRNPKTRSHAELIQCFVRFCFILGSVVPAVLLIALSYSSSSDLVVVLLTLGIGLQGLTVSGFAVNHLDIAPPFASVLLGITDIAATTARILTPTLTGVIVQRHVSTVKWAPCSHSMTFMIRLPIRIRSPVYRVVPSDLPGCEVDQ